MEPFHWGRKLHHEPPELDLCHCGHSRSRSLAAETLRIASPQRGSWEGAIPELGKEAGIFQKHGLDLDILYTQGGGETLCNSSFSLRPFRRTS